MELTDLVPPRDGEMLDAAMADAFLKEHIPELSGVLPIRR
jgi:hypothetical protein